MAFGVRVQRTEDGYWVQMDGPAGYELNDCSHEFWVEQGGEPLEPGESREYTLTPEVA